MIKRELLWLAELRREKPRCQHHPSCLYWDLWGGAVSYCLGSKFSRVSSLRRAKEMNCTWVWSTLPVWRYWKSLQYELPTIGQLKAEIWVRKFLDWLIPLSGTTSSEATSVNHFKNFGKLSFNVREDLKGNYTLVWGRRNQPTHVFYSFTINETSPCDLKYPLFIPMYLKLDQPTKILRNSKTPLKDAIRWLEHLHIHIPVCFLLENKPTGMDEMDQPRAFRSTQIQV